MSLSPCDQALAALRSDAKGIVKQAFAGWATDVALSQVSRNTADETALAVSDFVSFLTAFAKALRVGMPPYEAWLNACYDHQLKGRQVPADDCPAVLGRARSLEDHAKSIARASMGLLTTQEAKRHLLKHSGSLNPTSFEPFLRAALLGNHLVWATFDAEDPQANPFDRLPKTQGGICTALGLGGAIFHETLIVLVWGHLDSGSPPLHRPTVADAGAHPYYRPCAEVDAPWGLTEPLWPNLEKVQPQPEVVLPETTSKGLRLPFRVVSA